MGKRAGFYTHTCSGKPPSVRVPKSVEIEYLNEQREKTQELMNPKKVVRGRQALSDEQVRAIRSDLACGSTHAAIAEKHGVRKHTIAAISTGQNYAHVKD